MAGRPFQAKLTDEAAAGWDRFLAEEGRTFTAVIEALGRDLAARGRLVPQRIVTEAGRIDVERRSRRS